MVCDSTAHSRYLELGENAVFFRLLRFKLFHLYTMIHGLWFPVFSPNCEPSVDEVSGPDRKGRVRKRLTHPTFISGIS